MSFTNDLHENTYEFRDAQLQPRLYQRSAVHSDKPRQGKGIQS
jgi:hypothetical protein